MGFDINSIIDVASVENKVIYIRTDLNRRVDALSRGDMSRFLRLSEDLKITPNKNGEQLPEEIWPPGLIEAYEFPLQVTNHCSHQSHHSLPDPHLFQLWKFKAQWIN